MAGFLDAREIRDDIHCLKSVSISNHNLDLGLRKELCSIGTDRKTISSYFQREKSRLQKKLAHFGAARDKARDDKAKIRRSLEHQRPLSKADDLVPRETLHRAAGTNGAKTAHLELLRSGFPVKACSSSIPRIRIRPSPPLTLDQTSVKDNDSDLVDAEADLAVGIPNFSPSESLLGVPGPHNDLDLLQLPVATYSGLHRSQSFPELVEVGDYWVDRERLGVNIASSPSLAVINIKSLLQEDGGGHVMHVKKSSNTAVLSDKTSNLSPAGDYSSREAVACSGSAAAAVCFDRVDSSFDARNMAAVSASVSVPADMDQRCAPVISIEEPHEGSPLHGEESGDLTDDAPSAFLQVPQMGSGVTESDSDTSSSGSTQHKASSTKVDRVRKKKKPIQRRDTPPIRDSIYKLHLSPRGSRKVISADAISLGSVTENTEERTNDMLSPKSKCKVFMRQLNTDVPKVENPTDASPNRSPRTIRRLRDFRVRSEEIRPHTPTQEQLNFIQRALSPGTSPGVSPGGSPRLSPSVSPIPRRRLATICGGESSAMILQRRKQSAQRPSSAQSPGINNNLEASPPTLSQDSVLSLTKSLKSTDFKSLFANADETGPSKRTNKKNVSLDESENILKLPDIGLGRQMSSS